jgi:hypothetical protein
LILTLRAAANVPDAALLSRESCAPAIGCASMARAHIAPTSCGEHFKISSSVSAKVA